MSDPITIEVPDDDVPRMVASLREQATRSRALALACEQLANDMESQVNQRKSDEKSTS